MIREIVEIDEAKCDGCGQCIPSCAEGALYLEGGKVKLRADALCDGLGACLGDCPQGALRVVKRDAAAFDEAAVHAALAAAGPPRPEAPPGRPRLAPAPEPSGGCP
ncbi:MAG TPA: 4Fe-4S binding protein, partial [Anaeromyxobacteraceae bacterium]|nr:4Fe-4S binding protein [Anaeromyxobacteraceae bacterium]